MSVSGARTSGVTLPWASAPAGPGPGASWQSVVVPEAALDLETARQSDRLVPLAQSGCTSSGWRIAFQPSGARDAASVKPVYSYSGGCSNQGGRPAVPPDDLRMESARWRKLASLSAAPSRPHALVDLSAEAGTDSRVQVGSLGQRLGFPALQLFCRRSSSQRCSPRESVS